ncbi:NAD(P)/FAD-dependent oxidoreductase [Deinococcus maricopensis]|uniref:FAD-dependent pyridine nucleotide-disulfide oxidoreductase n=1 Tax=Deinococcus maricopensis (strain DSM 21211 / LMG 22137 / NRRL B-23946 / LB-34) TaxID=709986 RepID=E8U958_DEIML|nr:FAD-dependent oxidoreductase [Deinococcus maricopensis]ADV67597.1 FAD-dependent pyridine nucleotide-disulfide oxidoreductase [Deinococcus maricopensis DSM 21211]
MTDIVLLGGGYVTIDAYRSLMRTLGRDVRRGAARITVITPEPYHTFHGWTGEVLAGVLPLERTLTPLTDVLPHARLVLGRATRVDPDTQTVQVTQANGALTVVPYDHLLVGVGARDPFDRLPGLREHGWGLKDTLDMQRLHQHLQTWSPNGARALIVGGGFAGVEMAAALRERFTPAELQIHLASATPQLLTTLRPEYQHLAEYAEQTLRAREIHILRECRVQEVTARGARLSSGAHLPADLVLVTAGFAAQDVPGLNELPRHPDGRLLTDDALRVSGYANIWAGGDAAHVTHPVTGGACPTNALWAMKHGMCAGRNIGRAVQGRAPRPFAYRGLGQGAAFRVGQGITELKGMQFTGRLGWLMRLLFFVWYMPTKRGGARVLHAWLTRPRVPRAVRASTVPEA